MSTEFAWLAIIFCVGFNSVQIESAILDGNGYTLTVAVSEDFVSSDFDNEAFLASMEDILTRASEALFRATDNKVYFKNVDVLLPRRWISPGTPSWAFNYANADVRIETTTTALNETILAPRVHHSKPCGYSGEYIIVPPEFFAADNQAMSDKYGDIAKVFLHEWAHYRYGVFEEYGYSEHLQFPYHYKNIDGHTQVTGCNDTEIPGVLSTRPDATANECSLEYKDCRFRPDLTADSGPTTSLMYMQFLPQATKFCDSSNHNPLAPNQQNFWCRNRSVKTVIERHADLQLLESLVNTTDTKPTFRFLKPAAPAVYVLMDTSTHTNSTDDYQKFFDAAKSKIDTLLTSLSTSGASVPVSILAMSGTSVNSTWGLGDYVRTLVAPVEIKTGLQQLRSAVNNMRRDRDGILLDRALMDVANLVTPFTYVSGSAILVLKMSKATDFSFRPMETELINMLNARNSRLVTVEFGRDPGDFNMERVSSKPFTDGSYQKADDFAQVENALSSAVGAVLKVVSDGRVLSGRPHVGRDEVTLSSNVTGLYAVDERGSEMVISVHFPPSVPDDQLVFRLFHSNNSAIYDSSAGIGSDMYLPGFTSWNINQYKIHTIRFLGDAAIQFRFEISYSGLENITAYIDAIEILSKVPTIGGGSAGSEVFSVDVYTSADKGLGEIDMAAPGENPLFLIYAEVYKGFSFGLTTAVKTTVHDPRGGSFHFFLKDDGVYPDMMGRDGIYTGRYWPQMNGIHYVSVDAYRRNPNVPIASSAQPYLNALPVDQTSGYPYCLGESSCGSSSVNRNFRRTLLFATQLRVRSVQSSMLRPQRIIDLQLSIDANYSSATLRWTAPYNAHGNGSVDYYRLVYATDMSNLITQNGLISMKAITVNESDVLSGSLTALTPSSPQTVTVRLIQLESYYPIYFTVASLSNYVEALPAPVVFAPRRSQPPPTTVGSTSTAGTLPMSSSSSPSPSTASTKELTSTSRTTQTAATTTTTSFATETTQGSSMTTADAGRLITSLSNLMLILVIAGMAS